MSEQKHVTKNLTITKKDVDAIAGKLEQFAERLPEQERAVLDWILARATSVAEQDVKGFTLSPYGGTLAAYEPAYARRVAPALGLRNFGARAADTVGVSVSWSK